MPDSEWTSARWRRSPASSRVMLDERRAGTRICAASAPRPRSSAAFARASSACTDEEGTRGEYTENREPGTESLGPGTENVQKPLTLRAELLLEARRAVA